MEVPLFAGTAIEEVHRRADAELRRLGHRYTATCPAIVDVLADAALTIAALLDACPSLVSSSTYRNVRHLEDAAALTEAPGLGIARYELAEAISASTIITRLCRSCGSVQVGPAVHPTEAAVVRAGIALEQIEFRTDTHPVAFIGTCARCR